MNTPQTETTMTVESVANSETEAVLITLGAQLPAVIKPAEPEMLPPLQHEVDSGIRAQKALQFLTKEADNPKTGQKTWSAWMELAEGYAVARDYAKRCAGGNTSGKDYTRAWIQFTDKYGLGKDKDGNDRLDKSTRSRLLKCYWNRDEIEKWREREPEGRVLNNPVLIWQRFHEKPKKAKEPVTAANIVEELTDRFSERPATVAAEVITKKCRLDAKTHNTNARSA